MKLTVCADDFGQNHDISLGIIDCLAAKRISATSCLTTSSDWPVFAKELKAFSPQVDIGLHINFTEGLSLSQQQPFMSVNQLMLNSIGRRLNYQYIVNEIQCQLEQFQQHLGCLPDYLDGHQHVHQFPVIREAMLEVYQQHLANGKCYIRVPCQTSALNLTDNIKLNVIKAMGCKRLIQALHTHHIPHNISFSGIYNFQQAPKYAEFFPQFIAQLRQQPALLMCHPGRPSDDNSDAIAFARQHEYAYLMSEQYLDFLQQHALQLSRLIVDGEQTP